MSAIIERAFNKTQKIIRAVFRGSPNLITTSDLNRQFESMRYQADRIDERIGVISDLSLKVEVEDDTWTITPSFTYLEAKGLSFNPEKSAVSLFSESGVYLCLTADTETVTYASDFSHEIAGASFSDGTSMASADQLVYKNESIVVVKDPSTINNLVAVLARCTKDATIIYAIPNRSTIQDYVKSVVNPLLSRIQVLETAIINTVTVGSIMMWNKSLLGKVTIEDIKNSIPYGFVPCHRLMLGSATANTEFAAWSAYCKELGFTITMTGGSTYSINFAQISGVPLMDGRFPLGPNTAYTLGSTGGNESVTLTESQLPPHTHVYSGTNKDVGRSYNFTKANGKSGTYSKTQIAENGSGADGNDNRSAASETTSTGDGGAVNIMPPYLALYFIIKIK